METYLEAGVGGGFDTFKQIVIDRVVSDCERTVNNAAIYVHSKVDTEHIVVLKDGILETRVWSPVSSNVVKTQAGWETHPSFERISCLNGLVTDQSTHTVFDLVGELAHGDAGLCNRLHILADLTVYLGSFAVVIEVLIVHIADYRQMA